MAITRKPKRIRGIIAIHALTWCPRYPRRSLGVYRSGEGSSVDPNTLTVPGLDGTSRPKTRGSSGGCPRSTNKCIIMLLSSSNLLSTRCTSRFTWSSSRRIFPKLSSDMASDFLSIAAAHEQATRESHDRLRRGVGGRWGGGEGNNRRQGTNNDSYDKHV